MRRVPEFPLDPEELKRRLGDMHASYRTGAPVKIAVIEALWTRVQASGPTDEARVQLMLAVHSMVGAAPALGCEPLGAVARALETKLRTYFARGEALSEADAAPIGEVIALLGQALD